LRERKRSKEGKKGGETRAAGPNPTTGNLENCRAEGKGKKQGVSRKEKTERGGVIDVSLLFPF